MTTVNPERFGAPSRVRSGSKIVGGRMSGLATIPAAQLDTKYQIHDN